MLEACYELKHSTEDLVITWLLGLKICWYIFKHLSQINKINSELYSVRQYPKK